MLLETDLRASHLKQTKWPSLYIFRPKTKLCALNPLYLVICYNQMKKIVILVLYSDVVSGSQDSK